MHSQMRNMRRNFEKANELATRKLRQITIKIGGLSAVYINILVLLVATFSVVEGILDESNPPT